MKIRLSQPPKSRLQRTSFIHESKVLRQEHPELKESVPDDLQRTLVMPTWESCNTAVIKTDIPGILQKYIQTGSERKAITDEFLHNTYPPWSHGSVSLQMVLQKML